MKSWIRERANDVFSGVGANRSVVRMSLYDLPLAQVADKLIARGLATPEELAERALRGVDLEEEARDLGIATPEVAAIYWSAVDRLDARLRRYLKRTSRAPKLAATC